jgi:rhodanese-related sulfurtransferase
MQLFKVTTEHGADVIDPMDALQRMNSATPPIMLDVRSEREFHAAHIPGAVWIAADDLASHLADLPADREYVTVCRSGARSGVAAWQLRAAGFNVSNLCGGLLAWQRAGCPVLSEEQ